MKKQNKMWKFIVVLFVIVGDSFKEIFQIGHRGRLI